jgi:hypothetical protein
MFVGWCKTVHLSVECNFGTPLMPVLCSSTTVILLWCHNTIQLSVECSSGTSVMSLGLHSTVLLPVCSFLFIGVPVATGM